MRFEKETLIKAGPEDVFNFHLLPDAFERLTPPWESVKILQKADITEEGSQAILETKIFGLIPAKWVAEHTAYKYPEIFEDTQISGPFKSWRHRHIVLPHEEGAILKDQIDFEAPFWIFGRIAAPFAILPKLEKLFAYRHQITKEYCES